MAGIQKSKISPPPAIPDDEDDAPALAPSARIVEGDGLSATEGDADSGEPLMVDDMGSTVVYRCHPGKLARGKSVRGNWSGRVGGKLVSVDDGCPVEGLPGNVVKALGDLIEG